MGKWRFISHKSLSASSSPGWLRASNKRRASAETLPRIRSWRTREANTAPSFTNVDVSLFREDTREREQLRLASVGRSTRPSASHTHRVVFVVVFIAVGFFSISFPRKFIGVWCCAVLSTPVQRLKKEVTVELLCSRKSCSAWSRHTR